MFFLDLCNFVSKQSQKHIELIINNKLTEDETITSPDLFVLSALMPPLYIMIFLWLLTKCKPKNEYKRFHSKWIWYELVTFGYAFAISMSINYWMNKSLKILVSMPIPDFYERCDLDFSDPDDLSCRNVCSFLIIYHFFFENI